MRLQFRSVAAGPARRVAASRQGVRRSLVSVLAIVAAGVAPVLGWWAGAIAEPAPRRNVAGAGTLPAAGTAAPPTASAHYERLRAEISRTPSALNTHIAAGRQAATIGDITICPPVPPAGAELTSKGFYFLTQILPAGIAETSPSCGHALACFLGKMVAHQVNPNNPPSAHSEATLVIDRQCVVKQTLIVPDRFVLAGVGTEGRGLLVFDLPDSAAAIRFATSAGAPQRFVTIRDLNIVNASQCCGHVGIDVSNSSFVNLERIRLHDFGYGLIGTTAFSIFVDKSLIHNNGFNVIIGDGSTAWRLRDTTLNQSGLIGLVISPLAVGNFFSGGRVESNPLTGIHVQGLQNVIETTWFEGNGIGFGDHGIKVATGADQTRILSNLFSSEDVLDQGTSTQICFNTDDNAFADVNNCSL
jgi:hypothetical protein